jgi:hypothetical protein
LYFILFGLVAAFLSVFWTMGYRRLGERLRRGVEQPELAPPRSQARTRAQATRKQAPLRAGGPVAAACAPRWRAVCRPGAARGPWR